jgi:hypothetical protein
MQLNTKQVRAIVNNIAGVSARYTDKTLEDEKSTRRSVVWCFRDGWEADKAYKQVLSTFKAMGATNTVKRTGTKADMWKRTFGGEYVRIIAQIG